MQFAAQVVFFCLLTVFFYSVYGTLDNTDCSDTPMSMDLSCEDFVAQDMCEAFLEPIYCLESCGYCDEATNTTNIGEEESDNIFDIQDQLDDGLTTVMGVPL
eukprot:TRINITY_DN28656_c0_g1_i1.p3 TRINITY_DN28656_c0_g1~~TRINITY_DN28656_c0_g1_i1.p3  ORF type:complete len:119 (+),score=12.46 TRINITY_DN28656_c0_g1_i1:54-359(+)